MARIMTTNGWLRAKVHQMVNVWSDALTKECVNAIKNGNGRQMKRTDGLTLGMTRAMHGVNRQQQQTVKDRCDSEWSVQNIVNMSKANPFKAPASMGFRKSASAFEDDSKKGGQRKEEFDFEVFDNLSNKRKRHVIKELLVTGAPQGNIEDEAEKLPMRVICVNRTCKVTKAGVLPSFVGFVITGNGSGAIGYGKGKGRDVQQAVRKAHATAMRNLQVVELFENHTINHDIEHTFCKTKVKLMAAPKGSGVRANTIIAEMCRLAGIKDLRAKVIGSRHPQNTVKAVMEAFQLIQSPRVISRIRGVHMELVQ